MSPIRGGEIENSVIQVLKSQFSKGGPLEKSFFQNFSKSFYSTLEYNIGIL